MSKVEILKVGFDEQFRRDFSLGDDDAGLVQVGSKKWLLPNLYREQQQNYANFEVRDDDVWIIGMPRSGTTLTEEMVWLILNDLDFEKAKQINPYRRIPFSMIYTPHWSHIEQAWSERAGENFKFVFYEDLVTDLMEHVVEISKFLEKSLTEKQVETLVEVLQFETFKKYRAASDDLVSRIRNDNSDMVRKGEIGNWMEYFRGDLIDEADEWIRENVERIGIKYPVL